MSTKPRGDRLALLSFLLILPALATFVVGLVSSGTLPLYVSLACSVVAGLSLAVAARLRRRDLPADVEPLPLLEPEDEMAAFLPPVATLGMGAHGEADTPIDVDAADFALAVDAPQIEIEAPPPAEPRRRRKKKRLPPAVVLPPKTPPPAPSRLEPAITYDEDGTLVFPIDEYDFLSAAEVVKVLKLLDSEEMETVREYEAAHEARPQVLERIDILLARRGRV